MIYKCFSNVECRFPFHKYAAYQFRVPVSRYGQESIFSCSANEFVWNANPDGLSRLFGRESFNSVDTRLSLIRSREHVAQFLAV